MLKNPNWVYGSSDILVPARLNFGEFIVQKLWEHKDRICFINGANDEVVMYSEIVQRAMNAAVSLYHLGVRKGDAIAVCSENRREFFPSVVGAICAGAVVSTINVGYTPGELKHVINIIKPSYIFCSPFAYKNYEKTLKSLTFLKKILLYGDEKPKSHNVILYNETTLPNNGKLNDNVKYEEFRPVEARGDDSLFVLYSSGTTGLPKGVVLTHLNLLTTCCSPVSQDPDAMSLTISPWFHVMGLVGNLCAFTTGRTAVYLPKFDIHMYLSCIEKYKIVQLTVVPPILVALCKVDIKYDISTVRMIYSGAAPLHKDTLELLKIKFPKVQVLQGYGMTEVTLAVTRDTLAMSHLAKPGGVGFVCPGIIIKIVDIETRKSLGPNQRGELCVRGPIVMKEYIGKPSSEDFDSEGFFKTGDIGYYDEDKYFFIVDRLKELIKYKGYQVPPAEIEALLLQHTGVKDAAVIGIENKEAGEVPLAFVVRQTDSDVTENDVKKFVAERLSNPKHLRGGVHFVDQIPKNPSGKILRKNLRAMVKSGKSKL